MTGIYREYRQVHKSMSQLCISLSVYCNCTYIHALLTCFFVGLFVRPDDGAEVGEDQCSQSAGSFLWSAVVVE